MTGIQNGRNHNLDKPFSGCLGRVVNLFDLNTDMPGNRMLADGPYCNGSPLSRSRSDVSGMSPVGSQIGDKVIVSDLRRTSSNRKSNGTPMKMLIDEEMLKEVHSKQNPRSVIAKLMGLDALPQPQLDSASQRSHSRNSSRSHLGMSLGYWQHEHESLDVHEQNGILEYQDQNEYKDVYEIWKSHNNHVNNEAPPRGERLSRSLNENNMDLIRQNFSDLKRLATDEKLRQSKQFQDALEVLSSNKDLFLKFLQEPNSMFSQHLYDSQSISPHETKRITVLRPARLVDDSKFSKTGKKKSQCGDVRQWDKSTTRLSPSSCKVEDNHTQPTRIVVLKPSPGKPHDLKAVVTPCSSSPRALNVEGSYEQPEDDDAEESREVAKEITRQMRETLSGHRRDETLLSSVLSNGYNGDESSFNKSEDEYAVENLSDSEVLSPTTRHSWDYIKRIGSPYSMSSFSRASYSPESSVCREAKKRLSERWAMMASTSCREQKHLRSSSSTLGEMLAISDIKNPLRPVEVCSNININHETMGSATFVSQDSNCMDSCDTTYPINLSRSKSVPASSTTNGSKIDLDGLDYKMDKTGTTEELTKTRSRKLSLKGRVSSLFFSRNKKSNKDKSNLSRGEMESSVVPSLNHETLACPSECGSGIGVEAEVFADVHGSSNKVSSPELFDMEPKKGILPSKVGFSVIKPCASGNPNENQEQPSPISVLEPAFEEDEHRVPEFSSNFKAYGNGSQLPLNSIKHNLIDKSPPIGSISRTLSWDNSCTVTANPSPLRSSLVSKVVEEDQDEWFFVQTLLSAAGIDNEVQCHTFFSRWHSLESPLDPSLRDKYIDINEMVTLHEAKRRQRKSTRKLVFDCVNAALLNIAGYESEKCLRNSCVVPHGRFQDHASSILSELVWAHLKELFSGEVRRVSGEDGDIDSLVVDQVVRKEVVGKGWVEQLRLEIEIFQKEVEYMLLEELVQEAVEDFTGVI